MPRFGSQMDLARTLGITDRRVRQLEAEFVVPPPRDGRYDLDLAADRYEVFTQPDRADHERRTSAARRQVEEAERLFEGAIAVGSTMADVEAAARAHADALATTRFETVISYRHNQAAAHWALETIARDNDEAMGRLAARLVEIMGAQAGMTAEEAHAACGAQLAAQDAGHAPR